LFHSHTTCLFGSNTHLVPHAKCQYLPPQQVIYYAQKQERQQNMRTDASRTNISLVTPNTKKRRQSKITNKTTSSSIATEDEVYQQQLKAHDELRDLFMLFDSDNDGFISFIDLKNALMSLCEYESDHGIEEMMKKLFSSSEVYTDIRSMVIDFERFAQVFMYYHVNDEELDEDDEVLSALSNSPTTTAMSTSNFAGNKAVPASTSSSNLLAVPGTDSQNTSPNPTPKALANPILNRVRNAGRDFSRRRNDSLNSAYELSELIGAESDEEDEDEEDEPPVEQEEIAVKEEITLDEFVNRQVFRVLDLDGNGSITIGELKDLVLRYCPNDVADELDEDRLIDMLHLIDINSDGQVQYEEFIKLISLSNDKRYRNNVHEEEEF
jgi:Ca2+-binding EF-hand superfamily protein